MSHRELFSAAWFGPLIIALAALISVVATIDPAGSYPQSAEGPGLTVDEMFNVEQGVYLLEAIRIYGIGLLDGRSLRDVFGPDSDYLPDHPPLGRLWLGIHHHTTWAIAPPTDPWNPRGTVTACARTGSATAFALTILLIGWFTNRVSPRPQPGLAGTWASLLLVLMPRLWGHAHLASLESITNLMCLAAVMAAASAWGGGPAGTQTPTVRGSALAGFLLGLAFLTKIQAILLPLPIALWCVWRWRTRAVRPLLIWGVAAMLTFFVGWPWLWLDPAGHAQAYFTRTTARAVLSVWYFGTQYADKAVPWHYPWVMLLTTLPLATLLLGFWQLKFVVSPRTKSALEAQAAQTSSVAEPSDAIALLLWGNVLVPLIVFSLPNVAVYDCERLFLTAFPCWAMLAGLGAAQFCAAFPSRPWVCPAALAILLVVQAGFLWKDHPCQLSYYNVMTGGIAGAERRGLETTYWGDSLTRSLWSEVERAVPQGSTIHMAPVLHQFQLEDLMRQSPIVRRAGMRLVPWTKESRDVVYLLLFRRRADLPLELRFGPNAGTLVAEVRRGGAQLAALYRLGAENNNP